MSDFTENLIALNTLEQSHDLNGAAPLVMQLEKIDPAAMSSGVVTVDVTSTFGKDKGEVLGVIPLNSISSTNKALAVSAAAHATTAGVITLTLNSTNSADTTNLAAFYVLIIGRILPMNVV